MTDIPKVDAILEEIEALEGVSGAFLVSRSGMYVAGNLPSGVDTDIYASMFAVLLGSADTATSQLKERMDAVAVYLRKSRLVVYPNGSKALLVLRVGNDVRIRRLGKTLKAYSERLEAVL